LAALITNGLQRRRGKYRGAALADKEFSGTRMSDEAERIRRQMQDVRLEMGRDVHEVVERAKELSDWRYYVRKHPWVCMGSALAIGFLAMPGRKAVGAIAGPDVQHLVDQLKKHGLNVAAGTAAPGGLVGKALAIAGPIVLRSAVAMVSKRLNDAAVHQAPSDASESEVR